MSSSNNSSSSSSSSSSSNVNNDESTFKTNVLVTAIGARNKRALTGKNNSSPLKKIVKNFRTIENDLICKDPQLSIKFTEIEDNPAIVQYNAEENNTASMTPSLIMTASLEESIQNSISISLSTSNILNKSLENYEEKIEKLLPKKRGRPNKMHSKDDSNVRNRDFNKDDNELYLPEGVQDIIIEKKMIYCTDDIGNNKAEPELLATRNDDSDSLQKNKVEVRGSVRLASTRTATITMPSKSNLTTRGESSPNPTNNIRRSNDQENDCTGECSVMSSNTTDQPLQQLSPENDPTLSFIIKIPPAASHEMSADIPSASVAISHPVPVSTQVSSPSELVPPVEQKGRPKKKDRRYEDKVDSIQIEEISPSSVTSARKRHSERLNLGDIDTGIPVQPSLPNGTILRADKQGNDDDHPSSNNCGDIQSADMHPSLPLSPHSTNDFEGAPGVVENLSLQSTASTIDT